MRHRARLDARQVAQHAFSHHVAHEVDALGVHALAEQVRVRAGYRREQHRRQLVGHQAVDLLGHRHVARAQPRLQVHHRHADLGGRKRAGERGVHVAHNQQRVRSLSLKQLLERHHRRAGLYRVRAAAHPERPRGRRNLEILEEDVRHERVVVLPGVRKARIDAGRRKRRHQRPHLDEVRACSNHNDDAHC